MKSGRTPIVKLYLGDVVELRKPHPCGSTCWEIIRLGANVKLKCQGCGRVVMLPRSKLTRRIRRFVARPLAPAPLPTDQDHSADQPQAEAVGAQQPREDDTNERRPS